MILFVNLLILSEAPSTNMCLLICCVLLSLWPSTAVVLPDEQRLVHELFNANNYDNSVRPVMNASNNVVVMFGYTLIQIMDMVSGCDVRIYPHLNHGYGKQGRIQEGAHTARAPLPKIGKNMFFCVKS